MEQLFVVCEVAKEGSDVRRRADEVFEYIIEPVAKEVNLTATRSDKDPTPGQVTAQIIRSLTSARVVVADLTGRNPNVYYELAVAHSFGQAVIILVDATTELSFDTSTERVIPIGSSETLGVAQVDKAKKHLQDALTLVLDPDYKPRSLVSEAAGSRSLQDLAPGDPIATELALVRERLEYLIGQGPDRGRVQANDWERDAATLWRFIRMAADEGRVTSTDLKGLAESATSSKLRYALEQHAAAMIAESENGSESPPFS